MFELASAADPPARRGWSFAASLALQAAGLAALILAPLLNTYEIDLTAWARGTFHLAAPAPPAPPPAEVRPTPRPAPKRFEADLQAPAAIPDRVARLSDDGGPAWPIAGITAAQGPPGGLGLPGSGGVVSMIPLGGEQLPLPPPIRVGGRIQGAKIVRRVQPAYPREAVEQQVSGVVKLEAVIARDGSVRDVQLVEGHPLLAAAAIEAVSQWAYRPTRLNGMEVEVVTLIDVNFNLTILTEKEIKRRQKAERERQAAEERARRRARR